MCMNPLDSSKDGRYAGPAAVVPPMPQPDAAPLKIRQARPDPVLLGSGTAANAGTKIGGRRKQIDDAINAATQ